MTAADAPGLAGLTGTTLPERLLLLGLGAPWPHEGFDPAGDRAGLGALGVDDRSQLGRLCRTLLAGSARDPGRLEAFLQLAQREGRLADQLLLTQVGYAQARHRSALGAWLDALGPAGQLPPAPGDDDPATHRLLDEELPATTEAVQADPGPATQLAAVATSLLVVEGMLAAGSGHAVALACHHRRTAPGLHRLVTAIARDRRRLLAWATFTCRRLVAADDERWAQLEALLGELTPPALDALTALAGPSDTPLPGLDGAELARTGYEHTARRLGVIATGRGRDPQDLEVDDAPLALEQRLAEQHDPPDASP